MVAKLSTSNNYSLFKAKLLELLDTEVICENVRDTRTSMLVR
jgi:hypothetical protein